MLFAPSPDDLIWALFKFVVCPVLIIWLCVAFRKRKKLLALYLLPFFLFYVWLISDNNPASSLNRRDVYFTFVDYSGKPIPKVPIKVTQFRLGDKHYFGVYHTDQIYTSDSSGTIHVVSKKNIRLSLVVRDSPSLKRFSADLDRLWGDFRESDLDISWGLAKENENAFHSNCGTFSTRVTDSNPLRITLLIPSKLDDDFKIKDKMNQMTGTNQTIQPTR